MCVEERDRVGCLDGHDIFSCRKCTLFVIPRSVLLSENDRRIEEKYVKMFGDFLDSSGFYYSPTHDITHSAQRHAENGTTWPVAEEELQKVSAVPALTIGGAPTRVYEKPFKPLLSTVDERFFWNRAIAEPLIQREQGEWITPVVDGFIAHERFQIGVSVFDFLLISRRGCKRSGARFHTRGADPLGNVANFVETEQV